MRLMLKFTGNGRTRGTEVFSMHCRHKLSWPWIGCELAKTYHLAIFKKSQASFLNIGILCLQVDSTLGLKIDEIKRWPT